MASSRYENDLESKISEMSNYLDKLVTINEPQTNLNDTLYTGIDKSVLEHGCCPSTSSGSIAYPLSNAFNRFPQMNVTSALASRMSTPSSSVRFVHPAAHQRSKKWVNHKTVEKEPDTSNIDIDATMMELGLTPDSLTNNEVYRLFSFYKELEFYTHAAYIFDEIYEGRTLPNTMNASVQTKHSIWSCNKVLLELRERVEHYTHVPVEYQISLTECRQSLEQFHSAILKLEAFKFCNFEHRKGKFVSAEARENLNLISEAFTEVIDCLGKARMYVDVFTWALDKHNLQENEGAFAAVSSDGPSHPVVIEESFEQANNGRPSAARRYIG